MFVGGERAEQELVPQAGYELLTWKVASWPDGTRCAPPARWWSRPARSVQPRRLIGRLDPAAAVGAGGYVSGRSAWRRSANACRSS